MFKHLLKKEKSRIYLGDISVVPRSDLKWHAVNWSLFNRESFGSIEQSLYVSLTEIFSLPKASLLQEIKKSDLGLDVLVPNYQLGGNISVDLGIVGFYGVWRPKVEFAARVYKLQSGKTMHVETVLVKMPWRDYIDRVISWRGITGTKPVFDSSDMELLLHQACLELVSRLNRVV